MRGWSVQKPIPYCRKWKMHDAEMSNLVQSRDALCLLTAYQSFYKDFLRLCRSYNVASVDILGEDDEEETEAVDGGQGAGPVTVHSARSASLEFCICCLTDILECARIFVYPSRSQMKNSDIPLDVKGVFFVPNVHSQQTSF